MTRRRNGEDGAVAVLVVLGITALLGAALVAVDGGSVLHTRRGLVADTDAAALATAIALLDDRCAPASVAFTHAQDMATTNDAGTTVVAVSVDRGSTCTDGYGRVEVSTEHPASLFFAPVFGMEEFRAAAASMAAYGRIQGLHGLRPIGLCGSESHYVEWADLLRVLRNGTDSDDAAAQAAYDGLRGSAPDHPVYAGAGVVHRIPFQRLGIGACSLGGPAGNWGWLDFDGGAKSNADLDRWIQDGYDGEVDLGGPAPGDESCDDTEDGFEDCSGNPGGRGASTSESLDSITCPAATPTSDCDAIYVVVYDEIGGTTGGKGPPGANTEYRPASFAGLVLRGHELGTGKAFGDDSWIDIEFVDELTQGRIGASSPADPFPGPRGVQLCATEHHDGC